MSTRWKYRVRKGLSELATMVRASVSSGAATVVDGLVYQVVLTLLAGHYGAAAFLGAVLGGVTNFAINRLWAFRNNDKPLGAQASEYAFASLTTYVALQTCLFVLVEFLHADQRVAWIPAKIVAWLFVSYPLQRFLVFGSVRPRAHHSLAVGTTALVPARAPSAMVPPDSDTN